MRFFKLNAIIICFVLCLFVSSTYAADVAKIGLIDFQKILTTSNAGKEAQKKIAAKGQKLQADLKAKGDAIEQEKANYERESTVMTNEARADKERELKIKALDFQDLETKYKSDFTAYNKELVNQFKADVLNVVDQIGKKEGFLLILEKSEGGVVYAPSTIDITDQVIQKYNELFDKKSNG